MELPFIQTNIWDALIAVPLVLVVTQLLKVVIFIPRVFVPTIATVLGVLVSLIYSHPHDVAAGLFMGFFYGNAAVGVYASLKTSWRVFRQEEPMRSETEN
ncbi:hypothetical protein [Aureibacillus halotolerans]|uniref:Holin n=1 Tax=Aureibacillus halotolerans TaxID=1508390 RepID=A0A4R6UA22_9BACI|nr:hypothetical protein [Aureibacillus halotolerans]TDQ42682.1 hypothetical protein EV213_101111 [Aureibacillus halotolerans]